MSSYRVDGLLLPVPVGGHVALDFCNTKAGWGTQVTREYLVDPATLGVWVRERGLLDPVAAARWLRRAARAPEAARAVLSRALRLRAGLHEVLVGAGTARHWSVLRAELRAAGRMLRLRPTGAVQPLPRVPVESPVAALEVDPAAGLELPVLLLAWQAGDLLASPASGAVAGCQGPGCCWLFLDPRHRRRWCSMADCGNRAKARTYARRHRPDG